MDNQNINKGSTMGNLNKKIEISDIKCKYARLDEYPGYLFCEDGRILSERKGKFLKPVLRNNGGSYFITPTNASGKKISKSVHRLIYRAFWPNDLLEGYEIDHVDRNVANNALSNLRKVSRRENNHNRSDNTPFTSVSFHKQRNKYRVQILKKHYGYFQNHKDAVLHSIKIHSKLELPLSIQQLEYIESVFNINTKIKNKVVFRLPVIRT